MTKKKPGPAGKKEKRTARKARTPRRRDPAAQWRRGLLGVAVLVCLTMAAAFVAHRLLGPGARKPEARRPPPPASAPAHAQRPALPAPKAPRQEPPKQEPVPAPKAARQEPPKQEPAPAPVPAAPPGADPVPLFEVYPEPDLPAAEPATPRPLPADQRPKVAIIIDDLGYDRRMARKFLELEPLLTAAVLPGSPFQEDILAIGRRQGVEIMIHLPMEPEEYPHVDPGPGALLASMPPDRLIAQLEANLDAMPQARGVNNHMGSRLTRESPQMQQVFSVLKQRGLFFVDSLTSADSVARSTARLFQVPFAERDVFLDHVITPDFIRGQIRKLILRARQRGQALGIGHPHPATYETLRQGLPELKRQVQLVPASQVVHGW